MKKIMLMALLTVAVISVQAQRSFNTGVTTVLDTKDLSTLAADTTILYQAPKGVWGATYVWTSVSGSDTAFVYLSNDDDATNTFEYDNFSTYSIVITGTSGSASRAGERPELGYIAFYIPKMTGVLTLKVNVR